MVGKTWIAVNAYSSNACGSSNVSWDNASQKGTALLFAPPIPENLLQVADSNYPDGFPIGTTGIDINQLVNESSPAQLSAISQTPGICSVSAVDLSLTFIALGTCLIDVQSQGSLTLASAELHISLNVISTLPALNCGSMPSNPTNRIPGWTKAATNQISSQWVGSDSLQISWCPAVVVSTAKGYGPIIYTVTLDPGAATCTTWNKTSCTISGLPGAAVRINIMVTNEVGTNISGIATVANDGLIYSCIQDNVTCDPGPVNNVYQTYGNTSAGLGDCTFAAAADWEQIKYNVNPDATTIGAEFIQAGGSLTAGLTPNALFSYWENYGIAGIKAATVQKYYTDEIDVENGVLSYGAMLASLTLTNGQNIAGQSTTGGGHMVVVDGFTPEGPIIVSWGLSLQMTWQQWNLEVVGMWGINN